MPLKKGKPNVPGNIREMHQGPSYAKVKKMHGKKTADKMAVAAAMSAARGKFGKKR